MSPCSLNHSDFNYTLVYVIFFSKQRIWYQAFSKIALQSTTLDTVNPPIVATYHIFISMIIGVSKTIKNLNCLIMEWVWYKFNLPSMLGL